MIRKNETFAFTLYPLFFIFFSLHVVKTREIEINKIIKG